MSEPTQKSQPMIAAGAVASALAMATPSVSYQFTSTIPKSTLNSTDMPMSAHDMALIDAKTDAKLADLRGDLRLNTSGLADLKERFDELAGRMTSVPTDLATLKATMVTLPDKDWVGMKLRNSILTAGALFAMLGGVITWGPKLIEALK